MAAPAAAARARFALVTGGCEGIGRAMSLRLAAAGFTVAVTSRSEGKASDMAALLRRQHPLEHLGVACDVHDHAQVKKAAGAVVAAFGSVDVVVNNAGTGCAASAVPASLPACLRGMRRCRVTATVMRRLRAQA
jgi:NAD(P)-dependent dehydrogenase (short-subunit alcohol dehydrogenase family)